MHEEVVHGLDVFGEEAHGTLPPELELLFPTGIGARSSTYASTGTARCFALLFAIGPRARGSFPYSLDLIVKQPTLRNGGLPAVAPKERRRGSRAPTGAGGERRTRGAPRGHAYLRIAGDDGRIAGRRASRRPAAALATRFRRCLSSGPCLRVPVNEPGRQRAPRTGAVVPPGRVPKPPGSKGYPESDELRLYLQQLARISLAESVTENL
jgi:hypothetical protein